MATLIGPRPAKKAGKVLRRRVEAALEEIDKPGPLEPRLHEARLDLKKARATLKLLRPSIGEKKYKRENALCREAGRVMRSLRDAQVLGAAWRKLGIRRPEIARKLASDAGKAAQSVEIEKSRDLLAIARSRARKLAPARADWGGIEEGLRRSYSASRRAWRRARRAGKDGDFHEWRKRVKDQRYQVDLFVDGAQDLAQLDEALDKLSDLLGDDHDLVVLRVKIGRLDPGVLRAIGRRQSRLRGEALRLADPLYAESSKAFVRKVKRAWKKAG